MKGKTKKINSWDNVIKKISDIFNDGQIIDLEGIIYLIGLQELGFFESRLRTESQKKLDHH